MDRSEAVPWGNRTRKEARNVSDPGKFLNTSRVGYSVQLAQNFLWILKVSGVRDEVAGQVLPVRLILRPDRREAMDAAMCALHTDDPRLV